MKRMISVIAAIACMAIVFSSCGNKHKYYTFETELGDTFCLEVYLSGNFHGMYPHYLIYNGDESIGKKYGCALYVDRTSENCLPDDPISNITTFGTYGTHNFYKVFGSLFYYKPGVHMARIYDNYDVDQYIGDKKNPRCPNSVVYGAEAISDLMKSHCFEYIYRYGEIPAYDKDPEMKELMLRYAAGDFSDEERRINADSYITESDMTEFAKSVLEKYYSESAY